VNAATQLPGTIKFPGGYHVVVRVSAWGRGCACGQVHFVTGDKGDFCQEAKVITLWEGLTPRQRWEILAHEYVHAWVDWQYWLKQSLEGR